MSLPDRAAVERALAGLILPDGTALAASGRLSQIAGSAGRISVVIAAEPGEAAALEPLRGAAERALAGLPGVERAFVALSPPEVTRPVAALPWIAERDPLPGVGAVVAIASGKGGVGKSTTACNLAIALRARGLRVGLLDADVYGPSQPRLFGITGQPRVLPDRRLAPLERYGVKLMSIGALIEPEQALVWRGPMVLSAITQMLREVAWAPLDLLLVDLPPGTGDAQLATAEAVPLAGAVIVSTPQDLALLDVRRGIAMFAKLGVSILGLIENMAHFTCTTCGTRHDLFGAGGARAEAGRLGLPFLGEIPLALRLREGSDAGRPITALDPEDMLARAYDDIARRLMDERDRGR